MAAARPTPGDARVPCPMCGGLIHPIAGKCKHCKGDLANQRSVRPAATAGLPAIIATGQQPLNPYANGHANGHNGHANGNSNGAYAPIPQAASPIAIKQSDAMNPILPPRPTGRMQTAQAAQRDWWKSWPLVVIVLAVLAIVTAVVLMVFPPGKSANAEPTSPDMKGNKAMPAPERMETNPLPPKPPRSSKVDPKVDPDPDVAPPRPVQPKIDIPDDPDDDIVGSVPGNKSVPGGVLGALSGKNGVIMGLAHHLCDRAVTCNQADPALKSYCDQAKQFKVAPSNCQAANKCYAHIDAMSCTADFDSKSITKLMTGVAECIEAVNGC